MANNIEKQLKEISERLEQGVKEIFTSERYTEYLNTMSKFHNYSFNNTLLITMQKPEATLNIINLRLDITHLYYPAKNSFQKGRLKRREIFTELLLYTLTT